MNTTGKISQLIATALSPIIETYPVVVDALEGNREVNECAWYDLTPQEVLTKDYASNSAELRVALVCDGYDRAVELSELSIKALKAKMVESNVGVGSFTTSFEFSAEDAKHIAYVSTYLNY